MSIPEIRLMREFYQKQQNLKVGGSKPDMEKGF